jgi:prepilin-type N-terminal cleavage/methylation domain-containing protein
MKLFGKNNVEKGFTLIELLVVITIIGIFIMTAVPYLSVFIQNTQTTNVVDQLTVDLNSSRIEALSSGQDVTFEIKYSGIEKAYVWEITKNKITRKTHKIINESISVSFNKSKFHFSSLGFLQDENKKNITHNSITICNVSSKSGSVVSLNAFGKTTVVEAKC